MLNCKKFHLIAHGRNSFDLIKVASTEWKKKDTKKLHIDNQLPWMNVFLNAVACGHNILNI